MVIILTAPANWSNLMKINNSIQLAKPNTDNKVKK
jgi:hypothetical protein